MVALIYFPFGIPSGRPRILGVVPWMEWTGQVPAWSVLGLSAVAAIAYGARRYRPEAPMAWWFMGAGVLLFITGDTIYKSWHQIMGQQNIPFPSFIDAIYITMYPVLAIGLLLLARSRVPGGDQASLLDALIITVGVGLLSWIFLIGPNVRAPGGLLVRLTAAAYPLGRHPPAGHARPPVERRRVAQHRRPAAGHRHDRHPRGRLGIRAGRPAHRLELA